MRKRRNAIAALIGKGSRGLGVNVQTGEGWWRSRERKKKANIPGGGLPLRPFEGGVCRMPSPGTNQVRITPSHSGGEDVRRKRNEKKGQRFLCETYVRKGWALWVPGEKKGEGEAGRLWKAGKKKRVGRDFHSSLGRGNSNLRKVTWSEVGEGIGKEMITGHGRKTLLISGQQAD